jgi:hypothetical protein
VALCLPCGATRLCWPDFSRTSYPVAVDLTPTATGVSARRRVGEGPICGRNAHRMYGPGTPREDTEKVPIRSTV